MAQPTSGTVLVPPRAPTRGLSVRLTVALAHLSLIALGLSLAVGQFLRLPLPGQGGGLLLSDAAACLLLVVAAADVMARRWVRRLAFIMLLSWLPFILLNISSLLLSAPHLPPGGVLIAAAYAARLTVILLVTPALLQLLAAPALARTAHRVLVVTAVALLFIGAIQLFFPLDPARLAAAGWDPHERRLLSTWLDPNFFGAFLVIIVVYNAAMSMLWRPRLALIPLFLAGAAAAALLATHSRSSLLALLLAVLAFTPGALWCLAHRPRRASLASLAAVLATGWLAAVPLITPRLVGLLWSDDTVRLRRLALSAAWPLAAAHSLRGVGYNAYQFVAAGRAQLPDFTQHARGGTDNSWLNLWITTGLPGLLLFLTPWGVLAWHMLHQLIRTRQPLAAAALAALAALLFQANIINSFLYSHVLLTLAMVIALALTPHPHTPSWASR